MAAGITWGKVIGGATIAAGAVVMVAAFFPGATVEGTWNKFSEEFSHFFKAIGKIFTGSSVPAPTEGAAPAAPDAPLAPAEPFLSMGVQKGLLGAAMIGGGLALRGHMKGKEAALEEQNQLETQMNAANTDHQAVADMAAMQGLMKARMSAANPHYMAVAGAEPGVARGV